MLCAIRHVSDSNFLWQILDASYFLDECGTFAHHWCACYVSFSVIADCYHGVCFVLNQRGASTIHAVAQSRLCTISLRHRASDF